MTGKVVNIIVAITFGIVVLISYSTWSASQERTALMNETLERSVQETARFEAKVIEIFAERETAQREKEAAKIEQGSINNEGN
mgnify:CR=1 FL=1